MKSNLIRQVDLLGRGVAGNNVGITTCVKEDAFAAIFDHSHPQWLRSILCAPKQ
jgi:hypothetical protein